MVSSDYHIIAVITIFTDTEPIENCQSHIIFIINFKSNKLLFKIEIGVESSNFASEVIWSKEGNN